MTEIAGLDTYKSLNLASAAIEDLEKLYALTSWDIKKKSPDVDRAIALSTSLVLAPYSDSPASLESNDGVMERIKEGIIRVWQWFKTLVTSILMSIKNLISILFSSGKLFGILSKVVKIDKEYNQISSRILSEVSSEQKILPVKERTVRLLRNPKSRQELANNLAIAQNDGSCKLILPIISRLKALRGFIATIDEKKTIEPGLLRTYSMKQFLYEIGSGNLKNSSDKSVIGQINFVDFIVERNRLLDVGKNGLQLDEELGVGFDFRHVLDNAESDKPSKEIPFPSADSFQALRAAIHFRINNLRKIYDFNRIVEEYKKAIIKDRYLTELNNLSDSNAKELFKIERAAIAQASHLISACYKIIRHTLAEFDAYYDIAVKALPFFKQQKDSKMKYSTESTARKINKMKAKRNGERRYSEEQVVNVVEDAQLSNEGWLGALQGTIAGLLFDLSPIGLITSLFTIPATAVISLIQSRRIKELKAEIEHLAKLYTSLREREMKTLNPEDLAARPPVQLSADEVIKALVTGGLPLLRTYRFAKNTSKLEDLEKELGEKYNELKKAVADEIRERNLTKQHGSD